VAGDAGDAVRDRACRGRGDYLSGSEGRTTGTRLAYRLSESLEYVTELTRREEERWCEERRADVAEYLRSEGLHHGRVREWPAWHIAPYVSIWAIESATGAESVGWWVICGDLPTDYLSASQAADPREALRAFAARWSEVAAYMLRGEAHPTIEIGSPRTWPELAPKLKKRAELLTSSADDETSWQRAP